MAWFVFHPTSLVLFLQFIYGKCFLFMFSLISIFHHFSTCICTFQFQVITPTRSFRAHEIDHQMSPNYSIHVKTLHTLQQITMYEQLGRAIWKVLYIIIGTLLHYQCAVLKSDIKVKLIYDLLITVIFMFEMTKMTKNKPTDKLKLVHPVETEFGHILFRLVFTRGITTISLDGWVNVNERVKELWRKLKLFILIFFLSQRSLYSFAMK